MTRPRYQSRALLLGAGTLALVAGLVGVVVFQSPRSSSSPTRPAQEPRGGSAPDAGALGRDGPGAAAQGGEFFAQLFDRTDPSRVEVDLRAARSRPIDAHTQELTQPIAWIALRDGRLAYTRADRGRIALSRESSAGSLESGTLEGNVLVLLFAPGTHPTHDPESLDPQARLTTDVLSMDWKSGEMHVPHRLQAQMDQLEFDGSNVTARFDPLDNHLLFLHVTTTRTLRVHPGVANAVGATPDPTSAQAQPPVMPQPPAAPAPTLLSLESLFSLDMQGEVRISQGTRALTAPVVKGWVRLLNGVLPRPLATLPPPATSIAPAPSPSSPETTDAIAVPPPVATHAQPAPALPLDPAGTIVATWTGALEVRRLASAPAPVPDRLVSDDLALEAISRDGTPVVLRDDSLQAVASGNSARVGATQGDFVLLSPDDQPPASLTMQGMGTLLSHALRANIRTLLTEAIGPGSLTHDAPRSLDGTDQAAPFAGLLSDGETQGSKASTIAWKQGAEFAFARTHLATKDTAALQRAQFTGGVIAQGSQAGIEGDTLLADFDASPAGQPLLRNVWVQGGALLRSTAQEAATRTGTLRAHVIHATFTQPEGKQGATIATSLDAQGDVRVDSADESLRSGSLRVTFASQTDSTVSQSALALGEIAEVLATQGVRLSSISQRLAARGDRLLSKPALQQATLWGDAQGTPVIAWREGAAIEAAELSVDGLAQRLDAMGPGVVTYGASPPPAIEDLVRPLLPAQPAPIGIVARGEFGRSLRVDEPAGVVTLDGGARLAHASDERTLQLLSGEQLVAHFAERSSAGTTGDLRRVEALGGDGAPSPFARAVLRTLTQPLAREAALANDTTRDSLGLRDERLLALEAAPMGTLVASIASRTLDVPGPGVLRMADTRHGEGDAPAAGLASFKWSTSLRLAPDRSAGESIMLATMLGQVRMVRVEDLPAQIGQVRERSIMELSCDDLRAHFLDAGRASDDAGGQLLRVVGSGSVWARAQQREIVCERFTLQHAASLLEADGSDVSPVQLSTPGSPPMLAKRLLWNLRSGRVDVLQPILSASP